MENRSLVRPRSVVSASGALAILAALARAPGLAGQTRAAPAEPIDRLPYRIVVHLAITPECRIDARMRERLVGDWRSLVHRLVGTPWDLTVAETEHAVAGVDL